MVSAPCQELRFFVPRPKPVQGIENIVTELQVSPMDINQATGGVRSTSTKPEGIKPLFPAALKPVRIKNTHTHKNLVREAHISRDPPAGEVIRSSPSVMRPLVQVPLLRLGLLVGVKRSQPDDSTWRFS